MNSADKPPAPLDTVAWERDGGSYSGMVWRVRGGMAEILTTHGTPTVACEDLEVILPGEAWDRQELENHLRVVYGAKLPPPEWD